MLLTHAHRFLWNQTDIFDWIHQVDTTLGGNYNNGSDFDSVIAEVVAYSLRQQKDALEAGSTKDEAADVYNQTIGMLGEVLVEYILRRYPSYFKVREITDTTENEFTRGYDFWGLDDHGELAIIQVKMGKRDRVFTKDELYTFTDEAKKNVDSRYHHRASILVVPSNKTPRNKAISYKDEFNKLSKFEYFGGRELAEIILGDDCSADQEKIMYEFWCGFQEAVANSIK